MNSGFYITGLGKEFNSLDGRKEINQENKELKEFKEKIDLSFITEKNDEMILEKSKHNILDYLIREETNFSDLYKVEKYYKQLIIQNSKKYDKTNNLIKNKKQEIEYIQDLIDREIIANIDLEKQEMLDLYEIEKVNLKDKIDKYNLDNECYEHLFQRLYRNNVKKYIILILIPKII